jgi:hypothetical protein
MKITEAIIERIRRVNAGYQRLDLAVDESIQAIKPGQSLLVRVQDSWDPYLRQQWWPVELRAGRLTVERPDDEEYETSQLVNLLGLVGQPFKFRRTLRNVLLVAYDVPPHPLLLTIPWLLGNQISVTLVLLGAAAAYDTGHLQKEVEIIRGDSDFTWQNQVMTVGWADQVFVAAARDDEIPQLEKRRQAGLSVQVAQDDEMARFARVVERFKERRADVPKNYLFGVFRPLLPCGTGACQACMLRTTQGESLICTDGPAYDLMQLNLG